MQRDLVARLAFCLRGGQRSLPGVIGHPLQLGFRGVVRVAIGRIEHVLGELLRQVGLQLLQALEPLLDLALQFGAGQHEVAHRVAQRLGARRAQAGGVLRDRLVFGVQALIGGVAAGLFADLGQRGGVGRAQLGRIGHGVEVPDGAPGAVQAFAGGVEHGRHGVVIARHVRADGALKRFVVGLQQCVDGRRHVLGADLVKGGQPVLTKQWVGHGVSLL